MHNKHIFNLLCAFYIDFTFFLSIKYTLTKIHKIKSIFLPSICLAAQFVKQKLPDLLRSYVDADLGGSQEGGFQDIAIEVLHLLLSHLLFGQKGFSGVGQEQIDVFLKTLCRGKREPGFKVSLDIFPSARD